MKGYRFIILSSPTPSACVTLVKFNYNFKQPITFLNKFNKIKSKVRGGVGFSKSGKSLIRRCQSAQMYYNKTTVSTRFYTRSLFLFTNFFFLPKKMQNYRIKCFISAYNLSTFKSLDAVLFSVNFTDNRFILGSKSKVSPAHLLLYFSPGTRVKDLRDVFSLKHLWATSPGSNSVINYFDRFSGFLNLLLPSKKPRLFFFLSRASRVLKLIDRDLLLVTRRTLDAKRLKAGDIYNLGQRPKVRGVAMNPVDHPHGGRTKSIKLPKTPWGKVTKLK